MTRPNVLWFMTDQFNARCLSAFGSQVQTPHLDKLVAEGVAFSHAYCNNPICAPSRISFITGQYPHTHRLFGNSYYLYDEPNPQTLGSVFRAAGYQTALVGKSHVVRRWNQDGFEHIRYCDLCDGERDDPLSVHYFKYLVAQGIADDYDLGTLPEDHPGNDCTAFVSRIPERHSVERWTGDESIAFLEGRDTTRPFFLKCSFMRPHDPYTIPADVELKYAPEDIEIPASAAEFFEHQLAGRHRTMQDWVQSGEAHGYPYRPKNRQELQRQLAFYYSLISHIDAQVGRVLATLEASGEADNTVICFNADHGDFAGEYGMVLKNLGIQEAIHRIPFILKYPGCPAGEVRDEIVESVDFYPTLTELCGITTPECVEGQSVVGIIKGTEAGKTYAFCEADGGNERYSCRVNSIRSARYRLTYYGAEQGGELFDHDCDPDEARNLYDDPASAEIKNELLAALLEHISNYTVKTNGVTDQEAYEKTKTTPTTRLHKNALKWSEL